MDIHLGPYDISLQRILMKLSNLLHYVELFMGMEYPKNCQYMHASTSIEVL